MLGNAGMVAMQRRRDYARFGLPKGKIEEGETDEQAARREIQEEVGLTDLEYIADLGIYKRHPIRPDRTQIVDIMKEIHMFLFMAPSDATLMASREIEEVKWVPLKYLVEEIGSVEEKAWFTTAFPRVREAIQRD